MRFAIRIAKTDGDILATYAVMKQLRPQLDRKNYVLRVRQLEEELHFQLAALRRSDQVISVAGFRVCRNLGWGKFLYVDDLVTDLSHRSTGAGNALFAWLVKYARQDGCVELRLDSAVFRHEAHRFYLSERMDIACFHFCLRL
ncbi:MAG: GNAT family N-acetyltransferase [Acidobacteriota bacterium]